MSEDTEQSQKTEQATDHRLEKAREKGQVAFSKEVGHLFAVFGLLLIFGTMMPAALQTIVGQLKNLMELSGSLDLVDAENQLKALLASGIKSIAIV
ncbi:MAG: EscU/YscU/HrcU family type III secretion system export apparatus switch protein, partial [Alphaproteobacteria bacterium]|nr:EscU/YscU/HrcU family type III secretion system export apparatus switch protein [Alphaproteobacteria bacterium]